MTMPTHEKSYLFDVNKAYGGTSYLADHQQAMWNIVDVLTGFANFPWTIHDSNGWGVAGSLTWANAGSPHSWIVLNFPLGPGQLLIDLRNSGYTDCYMTTSHEGRFTGGTTHDGPTADDGLIVYGGATDWLIGANISHTGKQHFIHSTDGELSMWIQCWNSYQRTGYIFCKPQGPQDNWDLPYVFLGSDAHTTTTLEHFDYGTAQLLAYGNQFGSAKEAAVSGPGNPFRVHVASEGFRSPTFGAKNPLAYKLSAANSFSGQYPMLPVHLTGSEGSAIGHLGRMPDVYMTSPLLNSGDTLEEVPGSPTKEWAVFGSLVVPWNGTTPEAA